MLSNLIGSDLNLFGLDGRRHVLRLENLCDLLFVDETVFGNLFLQQTERIHPPPIALSAASECDPYFIASIPSKSWHIPSGVSVSIPPIFAR